MTQCQIGRTIGANIMSKDELIEGLYIDLKATQYKLDQAIIDNYTQGIIDWSHDLGLIKGQLIVLDPQFMTSSRR